MSDDEVVETEETGDDEQDEEQAAPRAPRKRAAANPETKIRKMIGEELDGALERFATKHKPVATSRAKPTSLWDGLLDLFGGK